MSETHGAKQHHHQVFDVAVNVPTQIGSKCYDDDGRLKRTGNIWTASAHIITAVIGSGVLSLAWATAQLGWIAGPTVLFLFSFVTYYTSSLLATCYRTGDPVTGKRNYTYMDAVRSNLVGFQVKVCGVIQYMNLLGLAIGYTITSSISMMAIERSNCFHSKVDNSPCRVSSNQRLMVMAEWTNLPEGILDLVISKLFDQDRYNFRLVCRSWNAAAATSLYPINVPCLIKYDRSKLLWEFFQYKSFFYRRFPEFENAEIMCSKYGWLLMCRGDRSNSLFFFNPFNGHTKPIVELHSRCMKPYMSVNFFHPPTSPDCFIIGISTWSDDAIVDVLRYGGKKNKWDNSTYKNEDEVEFKVSDATPVLHHGLVYFLGMRGDIATLDTERRAWNVYPKSFEFRKLRTRITRHFLLKIKGDEDGLYAVFMIHDRETVNVFRLLETEMKWERVRDLGDKMLYLSLPSSFGEVAKPKSMANTICFPVYDPDDNLVFYSLKTQRYHSFDGNYSFDNSSGLSRVHDGAAWITPIPTQQLSTKSIWYLDDDDDDDDKSDDTDGDGDDDDESDDTNGDDDDLT